MNYALTVYPLSNHFRSRLERALDAEPVYMSVAELRTLPVKEAFTRLRNLGGARLVLPLEDENSRSVLPVLTAIAAVANARAIEIRHPDLTREPVSRWSLLRSVVSLGSASVTAARDALACRREIARLGRASRVDAPLTSDGQALYLNANLWFGAKAGGSIGHVAGVVNALHAIGWPVEYATAGGRTMIHPDVPSVALEAPPVFGLPYELNYYRFNRMVVRQLRNRPAPRFIYQRMSVANYAGVSLSRHWGVPLVLEYNGSEAWIAKNWGRPLRYHELAVSAEDVALRHAHLVVTISEVLRDELVSRGVDPARVVCYPNCIDPEVFEPSRFSKADRLALRHRLGLAPDSVVATFIGTFGQWHGADTLARAIRKLAEEHGEWLRRSNLRFLLVGDGLKMPLVREILDTPACHEFVRITGLIPQAEAPSYLAASDVLLSPHVANADGSRFFGSPTKLFEYMAMGKAIVASDLDQIGQVLQNSVRSGSLPEGNPGPGDSRLAALFTPGDIDALIEALQFVVERPEWRASLGANARREALARYTWRHHVDAILGRLESVR